MTPSKLNLLSKRCLLFRDKIFNNLLFQIKNVAGNLEKFKIARKQFLYNYSFYTLEKYFNQSWIIHCTTKFLNILVFSSGVLFVYIIWVFIDCLLWADLISLYKPDVLFMYYIHRIIIIFILLSRPVIYWEYFCFKILKYLLLSVRMWPNPPPVKLYTDWLQYNSLNKGKLFL